MVIADHTDEILNLGLGTGTISPVFRTEVTTATGGQQLMHVKLKIKRNRPTTTFSLTVGEDSSASIYPMLNLYGNSPSTNFLNTTAYTNTNFENSPVTFPLAPKPTITGFTTTTTAGKGAIVSVFGTNFGVRAEGDKQQVQFLNANNTVVDSQGKLTELYLTGMDKYISWENNRIQFKLQTYSRINGINRNAPPGSGKFRVVTDWGEKVESDRAIDIQYALQTMRFGAVNGTNNYRISLPRLNCVNGIKFKLGSVLATNRNAVQLIERALAVWSNHLNIDLSLEKTSNNRPATIVANSANTEDGFNSIAYDINKVDNIRFMATGTHNNETNYNYSCGSNNHYGQKEADIRINQTLNWKFNITGNISSGFDFYGAILHEIGHAIGLRHVLEEKDLMHPTQLLSPTVAQRKTLTTGRGMAARGARDIITQSKATQWSCGAEVETLSSDTTNCTNIKPNIPSNLVATTVSKSSIRLTWTKISNATNYRVEFSTHPTTGFTLLANPTSTSYTHTGLVAGRAYYYKIKAINASGDSSFTSTVTATTLFNGGGAAPKAPTNPSSSTNSLDEIIIIWNDNSTNETGFRIERSLFPNSGFTPVGNVSSNTTSFTDTNFVPNTNYYYRVNSLNRIGASGYTNAISVINCSPNIPSTAQICGPFGNGFDNTQNPIVGATVVSCANESNAKVNSGANILVQASKKIVLRKGFKVNKGGIFKAKIISADCDGLQNITIIDTDRGKKEIEQDDTPEIDFLQVYPNPCDGLANIQFNYTAPTNVTILISNSAGALIKTLKYTNVTNDLHSLEMYTYDSGVYFVTIQTNKKIISKRIVVK
ncbi:fibronectin type III domain-containing protein [Aquimarina agarivorans]|uniref:fibronectin type III domain-containing protein n=1 Tax=Aquimarina agarivorans TaxID=980584 RepID=UPI000248EBEB|nr:fibronectin type III domain-containing protein [Aquimarina agarivorans]